MNSDVACFDCRQYLTRNCVINVVVTNEHLNVENKEMIYIRNNVCLGKYNVMSMFKNVRGAHLDSSIRHITPKPCSIETIGQLIFSDPLMGFSPSLCSDSFDDTHLPQVNLQPLIGISIFCYPCTCSSMTVIDVETGSVRSVVIVVRRRGPKMTRQDTIVFHTKGHSETI